MDPSLTPTSGADRDTRAPKASPGADPASPAGAFVELDGEAYYRISAFHRLHPFLMSLASDTDIWMFVTSGGGLTAGRRDPDGALFPYETVDKLHDGHHHTGPITLLRVRRADGPSLLWEPFAEHPAEASFVERNLYKNIVGSRLLFEEIRHDLGLRFRYRWSGCDEFGIVRTASLENLGAGAATVALLDGLRNILPHGAPLLLQQQASCLVDAYKRAEVDPATRLGIFSLTAKITDRAEAAEELRATTVWSRGLETATISLSLDAVNAFRSGDTPCADVVLTGRRGNYLVASSLELCPGAEATWQIVADVGQSHVHVAALQARLLEEGDLGRRLEASLAAASENLVRIVGSADGLQRTGHPEAAAHHFASVLFNNMRGGIFAKNYDVPTADLIAFVETRNRAAASRHRTALRALPAEIAAPELLRTAEGWQDANILRLCYEYLPLTFGRRHGDPSRPWNRFAIRGKNADGEREIHYEGNWRDIFQNWEALCFSFPEFLPGVIAKFVNASTVDGFNPYRITRDGIDWEVPEPDAPWSHIGYWGDHQIVYLLRLLEAQARFSPGTLERLIDKAAFCYADVPYRLKSYEEIVADPRASIVYDADLAAEIEERVATTGTDGRLVRGPDAAIHHVTLLEKLFVPALSKMSNFVPGGGIWMNTQRPEWNDANNALAGNGVSMVTLFYLRRYLRFLERLLEGRPAAPAPISAEVATWLRRLQAILHEHRPPRDTETWNDDDRKRMLDALGNAFSEYRDALYLRGFSGATTAVPVADCIAFCRSAGEHIDHAIRTNRREDGLYHSYNILQITRDGQDAHVRHLEEMLEGQVAALGSGAVDAGEAVRLLSSLFDSRLYRPDQRSFLLYPVKTLPGFRERNRVPEERVMAVPLLRSLLDAGEKAVLERDALGVYRFHGDLRHAVDLGAALDHLARSDRWSAAVRMDRQAVLDLFESVFGHHAYTGRSGAMYAYEGLGSIYWHMVAKLLLAVQELSLRAAREAQPKPIREALAAAYFRIRAGFGFEKTVSEYGAFPTDPYSHTPAHAGAKQPGMTGQVKEMILARHGELGVTVERGLLSFRPSLLRRREFLAESAVFRYHERNGAPRTIELPAGSLAFTVCQVPVVYALGEGEASIRVTASDGNSLHYPGCSLDVGTSRSLFRRTGTIARIDVVVPDRVLVRMEPTPERTMTNAEG